MPSLTSEIDRSITIEAIMPAATLVSSCKKLTVTDIIGEEEWLERRPNELAAEVTCPDGTTAHWNTSAWNTLPYELPVVNWVIHGKNDAKCYEWNKSRPSTYDLIYASLTTLTEVYSWYQWNYSSKIPMMTSKHVWACDYSWSRVMVTISMLMTNGELIIDHSKPPRPNNSTLRSWDPPLPLPYIDAMDPRALPELGIAYPMVTSENIMREGVFIRSSTDALRALVQPWGEIPIRDMADPEKEESIIKALTHNRAVLSAQLLSIEHRLGLNQTSTAEALPPIEAVFIDHNRQRIV
ncbi:hypothetical protein CSOJ01_07974 [Colletotrichum sojae]|uniref:Uncharacterized protein n=1 Tax=Colletotrichum sojae TaxID=2175907 RepID=A0A8H6J7F9_9PEZI|nr:hypothetical protein CSOJ01_07974 [Colletotrichum sojae]